MFSKAKKSNSDAAPKADARKQVPSIISASLRIVGNLVSAGDVQVDGIVDGDVKSRSLTISQGAAVNGAIEADSVYIQGEVSGQITAKNVVLGASARVVGDVVHSNLVIESGAFLEGHCRYLAVARVVEDQPAAAATDDAPSDVESATAGAPTGETEPTEENTRPREATAAVKLLAPDASRGNYRSAGAWPVHYAGLNIASFRPTLPPGVMCL